MVVICDWFRSFETGEASSFWPVVSIDREEVELSVDPPFGVADGDEVLVIKPCDDMFEVDCLVILLGWYVLSLAQSRDLWCNVFPIRPHWKRISSSLMLSQFKYFFIIWNAFTSSSHLIYVFNSERVRYFRFSRSCASICDLASLRRWTSVSPMVRITDVFPLGFFEFSQSCLEAGLASHGWLSSYLKLVSRV